MLNKSKTKNHFGNYIFSSQKNEKKSQYISRSTNKKISSDKNKKIKINNNSKEFKISSTLMEMCLQTKNNKYKKNISDFSQNNSLYNLIAKNKNNNMSIPKTKLLLQENSINNSSLIFNINEDMKMKNNNSVISFNKQNNSKQKISNFEKQNNKKNVYHKDIENKNNINIQKYSIKNNYDINQRNYGKYINSNNNSKEESITKNKKNCNISKSGNNNYSNNNNDLILDSNNNNYITYHKNKNINNKYILQKILTNLFSSNKKNKVNIRKDNNNNRENKFINDSFNNNKIINNRSNNNYLNLNYNDKTYIDKRKETPRLKSNNCNIKKISGLFSANNKDKESNIITDIGNSKSKKTNENINKRNLSINIHSCNINECKFKTSLNYDVISKKQDNIIPKVNLNQVFNLKLYEKTKIPNSNSNFSSNNNNINNNKSIKENINNNIKKNFSNNNNKKLFFISNNNIIKNNNINNFGDSKEIITNKQNDNKNNTIQDYSKKKEQKEQNAGGGGANNIKNSKTKKFSPKNIYTKDIRKSHLQRFFSYSKEKKNIKNNNNNFMNNIKKINFNDNKKSLSKNSTRRCVNSHDNKSQSSNGDLKCVNKDNNCNSHKKYKKGKELISDSYINLRKKKTKYSDINKIINLKCLKYINNSSEINNLKKCNNNKCNTNETIKKNNNQRKNNHSASHNNLNNNKGKYDISRIGNLFKPVMENNIRGSYKEANKQRQNFELLSSLGKKMKTKNKINNNNYSNKKNKNNNEHYKNIRNKNKYYGIYDSNIKENNYNSNLINNINKQLNIGELVNLDIDENKANENIAKNSLTMYSIYILSKYYNYEKIGISKISLYDTNKNLIPIEYSNTSDNIKVNYLFDVNPQFSYLSDKINDSYNIPLIAEFKDNYNINFYIKNIYNSSLEYIYIYNYSDVNNGISPVKEIEIFKTNVLLYKGCLELNNPNIIHISSYTDEKQNQEKLSINDLINNEKGNLIKNKGKSLTFTIFKSLVNDNLDPNDNNFKFNKYNSARNTFHTNRYAEDFYNINNKNNENNNINQISNSYINNLEYNNENGIENQDNALFFQTNYDNNNFFSNTLKDFSKTNISNLNYLGNEFNLNFQNENENNFSKTLKSPNYSTKLFLNSYNSAFDDCDNLFRTSIGYMNKLDGLNNYNNNNDNNNLNINDYNNNLNSNDYNDNNYICDNNENNNIGQNYIEFNNIMIHLKSNYGHRKYIGLTGIIFIDDKNEQINIEKAKSIGAMPKDLRTVNNDDSDYRIFENVFNGNNNTNDIDNMWVTKLTKNDNPPYMELDFEEKIKLSKIIIYNYNEKDKLDIGTKTIDFYFDNYYYKTIYLKQGTGEVANVNNDKNLYDFGQEIRFNSNFVNNEYDNFDISNKMSSTGVSLYEKEENRDIKYASNLFEQCYETPYLPCGNCIKFQFMSYYCDKHNEIKNNYYENDLYFGLNNIEIYNEEGINILKTNMNNKRNNFKIMSNRELKGYNDGNNKNIIIKGIYNEDENKNIIFDDENNLFYFFDKFIQISYIKLIPFDNDNDINNNKIYKIKEIKIFCEDKIIFEGSLYDNKPTIILFTSENKIIKGINKSYLTKYIEQREVKEIETKNYYSLILN